MVLQWKITNQKPRQTCQAKSNNSTPPFIFFLFYDIVAGKS